MALELTNSGGIFDLPKRQRELNELEQRIAEPGFWDSPDEAQKYLQQLSQVKAAIDPCLNLLKKVQDLKDFIELAAEEEDESVYEADINADIAAVESALIELELTTLLSCEHDQSNAILEINAGAGGTESCDWVSILLRMYLRWAERRGYGTEIIDSVGGDVAGYKNVTIMVTGLNAYGYLRSERGVHRLVRISPYDANKRRHTSFASVDVIPEITEADDLVINPEELRVDTFRASGAGGQHVNKTESAIRITHIPTGIVVTCQNERSQRQNKEVAMKVLKARLMEVERRENEAKMAALRGDQMAIEWGSQIRSYVYQPYQLVKDHRTDAETGNLIAVMDGDIDMFIQAYLRWDGARG